MANVMIVGAGTVGQANGIGLMSKGHEVVFLDIDPNVVGELRAKTFNAYLANQFYSDSNIEDLDANIAIFCVPTPFIEQNRDKITTTNNGQIDLSNVICAVGEHAKWLNSVQKRKVSRNKGIPVKNINSGYNHLIVIRSTIPPQTTRKLLIPLIQSNSEMEVGTEIGLCMQPEFLRTSSSQSDFLKPRATIIGEFDKTSGDILENLYADFESQIFRTDLETAEFMKYVQNSFNATKISFANEMYLLGQKLGIDANYALQMASVVGEGFWNPKYGMTGGQPYNGACLPKDIKGFLNFAKGCGFNMPILSAVESLNSYMKMRLHKEKEKEKDNDSEKEDKLEQHNYANANSRAGNVANL